MSDIQRYGDPSRDYMIPAHDDGFVVLYADHVAAVAAAEQRGREAQWADEGSTYREHRQDGFDEGVKATRDAVAPMEAVVLRIAATLVRHPSEDERHDALQRHWSSELKSALFKYRAAIDALEKP